MVRVRLKDQGSRMRLRQILTSVMRMASCALLFSHFTRHMLFSALRSRGSDVTSPLPPIDPGTLPCLISSNITFIRSCAVSADSPGKPRACAVRPPRRDPLSARPRKDCVRFRTSFEKRDINRAINDVAVLGLPLLPLALVGAESAELLALDALY